MIAENIAGVIKVLAKAPATPQANTPAMVKTVFKRARCLTVILVPFVESLCCYYAAKSISGQLK